MSLLVIQLLLKVCGKDLDLKIGTIRYNILNLPDTIQFANGNQIVNRYAADGRKLGTEYYTRIVSTILPIDKDTVCKWTYQANVTNQSGTAYIDNIEINTTNGTTLARSKVYNDEGYMNYSTSYNSCYYNYYRRDHLGNNREVWRAEKTGVLAAATVQQTQYYPSGIAFIL